MDSNGKYPGPYGIAGGPDGNIWFTGSVDSTIGRITPSGVITEFSIPNADHDDPSRITTGPDGNLWFTEGAANKIGRITPSGVITEFPIPTADSGSFGITLGPDGNLWFTEESSNQIGRITPSGVITEFPLLSASSQPTEITSGPDGNLWFTQENANEIGRITPSGVVTEFPIPNIGGNIGPIGSEPIGIASGPDGDLWFTEYFGSFIGQLNPTRGIVAQIALPASIGNPDDITDGPDGNLWFTSNDTGRYIGQISTTGVLNEFPIPINENADAADITSGPDGNVWLTEPTIGGGDIGRVNLSGASSTPPAGPADTTVTLTATSPAYAGQNVTLTATVAGGAATPGGTVQFEVGGTDLGPAQTLANGVATYSSSAFPAGTADVSAVYTPSDVTQWNPSTGSLSLNVQAAASAAVPLAASVPQAGSFALTVDTASTVTLAVSGSTATGTATPILVSDTRNYYPGWSVSGQDSSWTGSGSAADGTFSGDQLGWQPTSSTAPLAQGVTLGAAVTAASPGLGDTAAVLASVPAGLGNGYGKTTLGAGLTLAIPPTAPNGPYTSGLTISAVSSSP